MAPLVVGVVGVVLTAGLAIAQDTGTASKPKLGKEDVEKMMDTLSNWGRWGSGDELGTLNLVTPQKRRQAARVGERGNIRITGEGHSRCAGDFLQPQDDRDGTERQGDVRGAR